MPELKFVSLLPFISSLPAGVVSRLYSNKSVCLAVFNSLNSIGQQVLLRLLYIEEPVRDSVLVSWSHHPKHGTVSDAWKAELVNSKILEMTKSHLCTLNSAFKTALHSMLTGCGSETALQRPTAADKYSRDFKFLFNYAQERWASLLHFMVGSKESQISVDTLRVVLRADLMKEVNGEPVITPGGFQFLLMDRRSQVWFFLYNCFCSEGLAPSDLVEMMAFLFELSFSTIGNDYSSDSLTSCQSTFCQFLREMGLVYQRKRSAGRFYPTPLVTGLTDPTVSNEHRDGSLVIETNYRVYSYSSSVLHHALLALFCEMECRFPDLSVAVLTRDSVRQAFSCGITAEQIITFLHAHAHPQMLAKSPVIPTVIQDQIRLWELERDRFRFTNGALYSQFLSDNDFGLLRDYARDLGVLVWENPQRRTMMVTESGHPDVKKQWKRLKMMGKTSAT